MKINQVLRRIGAAIVFTQEDLCVGRKKLNRFVVRQMKSQLAHRGGVVDASPEQHVAATRLQAYSRGCIQRAGPRFILDSYVRIRRSPPRPRPQPPTLHPCLPPPSSARAPASARTGSMTRTPT